MMDRSSAGARLLRSAVSLQGFHHFSDMPGRIEHAIVAVHDLVIFIEQIGNPLGYPQNRDQGIVHFTDGATAIGKQVKWQLMGFFEFLVATDAIAADTKNCNPQVAQDLVRVAEATSFLGTARCEILWVEVDDTGFTLHVFPE